MNAVGVGDTVSVTVSGGVQRAKVMKSHRRRFVVMLAFRVKTHVPVGQEVQPADYAWTVRLSFERHDERKTWCRGWDTEEAVAWRAEKALESCR